MIDGLHKAAGCDAGDPANDRRGRLDNAEDQTSSERIFHIGHADGCPASDRNCKGIDGHAHGEHGNGEWRHWKTTPTDINRAQTLLVRIGAGGATVSSGH